MIIKIYKEAEGKLGHIGTFEEAVKDDYNSVYMYLKEKCSDVFGGRVLSLPKLMLYSNPEGKSTFRIRKGSSTGCEGRAQMTVSPEKANEDIIRMTDIIYEKNGEEVTEKFGAEFLYDGFVISTGVTGCNIFGLEKETYVTRIGKKAYSGWKPAAKKFRTAASARSFVKKHEADFRYLAGNSGWKPRVMFVSDVYEEYLVSSLTGRRMENIRKTIDEANAVLDRCVEEAAADTRENGLTATEEALFRMRDMKMMKTVMKKFTAGTLMMSEFGGILYDLDSGAKAAAAEAKEKGLLPYHVIKTQMNIGTAYAVLYVSSEQENWETERYDPATGITYAYVSNGIFTEFGTIVVKPCNGGLARTA